jgi:ubiquinone/menaquinone biosynthesis C-methylase UbiE
MAEHICPWWGGFFIDNRLRRLLHKPEKILARYIGEGMTVMDFGCGMGFFSIAVARMLGGEGSVIAVDLQPQMLQVLRKRAERAGVAEKIRTHQSQPDSIGIDEPVDFVLAFWSIHEVPDTRGALSEVHHCLAPGGTLFVAEPRGHVSGAAFADMIAAAQDIGLHLAEEPRIRLSRAATFTKQA